MVGLLAAAGSLLLVFTSYLFIRKNCCEQIGDEEIHQLERAANSGSIPAMKRLYVFFDEDGQPAKAEIWLRRAADKGDARSEFQIWDRSDPSQKASVMKYLYRAAEHGLPFAQATLGKLYLDGIEVQKNKETAKYWLQKGARAGDPDAVLALCDMAAIDRDVQQCKECIFLGNHAIELLQARSYYVVQLRQQRERIEQILKGPSAP